MKTFEQYLQKQKSYICIRYIFYQLNCFIYKSRNLIYVLDTLQHKNIALYLQKQKSYICIRQYMNSEGVIIYKSRNLIYVLDYRTRTSFSLSTKVEILYMYQIVLLLGYTKYLQKQKSYICIRFIFCIIYYAIYKSRNLIYVLDQIRHLKQI